jgi:hypothetical protein
VHETPRWRGAEVEEEDLRKDVLASGEVEELLLLETASLVEEWVGVATFQWG